MSSENLPEKNKSEQGRDTSGRWRPGESGNPAGRPRGKRGRAAELFDEIVDERRFRSIVEKAAALAEGGNVACLGAILKLRIPPPREIAVQEQVVLPELKEASDAVAALRVIAEAAARGDIDADHARGLTVTVTAFIDAIKVADLAERIATLESRSQK
jgi:hypothetical protein